MASQGESIDKRVKSTIDVLRVIALLSGSDVELKTPVRIRSMKIRTRRIIVSALEKVIKECDIKPYASL